MYGVLLIYTTPVTAVLSFPGCHRTVLNWVIQLKKPDLYLEKQPTIVMNLIGIFLHLLDKLLELRIWLV